MLAPISITFPAMAVLSLTVATVMIVLLPSVRSHRARTLGFDTGQFTRLGGWRFCGAGRWSGFRTPRRHGLRGDRMRFERFTVRLIIHANDFSVSGGLNRIFFDRFFGFFR